MNELDVQIAACVFCKLNLTTNELTMSEKPYFYLDMFHSIEGDYAVVHNGTEFGIVRIVRVLPATEPVAVKYVSKPLLATFQYNQEKIASASGKLATYKEATINHRVQDAIDKKLEEYKPNARKDGIDYLE